MAKMVLSNSRTVRQRGQPQQLEQVATLPGADIG